MPLIEFWSRHAKPGIHPSDVLHIPIESRLHLWSFAMAQRRKEELEVRGGAQHEMLHIGLYPQPFIGNIRAASAYILFGNPGFSFSDYRDEFTRPAYAALCSQALSGSHTGFTPLHEDSVGTGANVYWESTLRRLIGDVQKCGHLSESAARELVSSRLAVIEAGAYHSRRFPKKGFREQPSAKAAKDFVRNQVLPRAQRGECAVLVWRSADFWDLPDRPGKVMKRESTRAHGRYLLTEEREFLKAALLKGL